MSVRLLSWPAPLVALALAASVLAASPVAGAGYEKQVNWKMAGGTPSSVPVLGERAKEFGEIVTELSGGKFNLRFYEPGALVPALQILDAIRAGSLDSAIITVGNFSGKEIAFPLFGGFPFGPDHITYLAWMYNGGGMELLNKSLEPFNAVAMPAILLSPEASGWFREEITSVDQLKGLKMRFFGLGAKVMGRIGVSTQLLAGGDIYPALERGVIDATEYSSPAVDIGAGFHQIAKHYYFPGWHQRLGATHFIANKEKWEALPEQYRKLVEMVARSMVATTVAQSESAQGAALAKIKGKGVSLHRWSDEFLALYEKHWEAFVDEQSKKSGMFAETWESLKAFQAEYDVWRRLQSLE
jgi:TRAP-type mannitol/chloroaromatic compound transport system substrate-binding protein